MKLHTLLLPTGEFVIVGSDVDPHDLPSGELMSSLADGTGAAGVLFTQQSVEVDDALFNENARRRPPKDDVVEVVEPDENETATQAYFRTFIPQVEFDIPSFEVNSDGVASLTGRAVSSGWTDVGSMSPESLGAIFGVDITRDYSPAGLVIGNTDSVLTDGYFPPTEPGSDPTIEHGQTVLVTADGDLGQVVEEPTEYQPHAGDHVRIVHVNGHEDRPEDTPFTGAEGVVVGPYGHRERGLWQVDVNDGTETPVVASKVELVALAKLDEVV